jgi:hypothetical protein
MPHNQRALAEARQAGLTLARNGESRAYVNDVARTLPADEADALLAGYYQALRASMEKARRIGCCVQHHWLDR